MPGRGTRGDDLEAQLVPIRAAMGRRGVGVDLVQWDDQDLRPADYAAILPLFLWDYPDRPGEAMAFLERAARDSRLINPLPVIRWNMDKRYLRDVGAAGLPVLETVWLDAPAPGDLDAAFDALQTDEIVAKRVVGAGARGQHRLRRGDPEPALDAGAPYMVQAFEPAVVSEGEYSLLAFDGRLSHALVKRPAPGDYRIQPQYGGRMEPVAPDAEMQGLAAAAFDAIEARGLPRPAYARVDLLRGRDGALRVIELELFEPYLYPRQGPGFEEAFADAVLARLA